MVAKEKPVTIGMMRSREQPGATALALAHAALMQGAKFFFFNPQDVNLAERTIDGRFFRDGEWKRRRTGFPDVIDNDVYIPPIPEVWDAMVRHARITTPFNESKEIVYARLRKAGIGVNMLIPTVTARSVDDLSAMIAKHGSIVIKPAGGAQGKQVMFVTRDGEGYRANYDEQTWKLGADGLAAFYADKVARGGPYLVQKYVDARTARGLPWDLRVAARRGRSGEWEHYRIVGRVGGGRDITANYSSGGSVCHGVTLLRARFGKEGEEIHRRMQNLARNFPPAFDALYEGKTFDALGLDIGVDSAGRPWLFEVNTFPAAAFFEMKDAVPRIGYAIFLARNPDHPDGIRRG